VFVCLFVCLPVRLSACFVLPVSVLVVGYWLVFIFIFVLVCSSFFAIAITTAIFAIAIAFVVSLFISSLYTPLPLIRHSLRHAFRNI
jgi:hypothetical protein